MEITPLQRKAITAIQEFFLQEGEWAKVELALKNARAEQFIEKPYVDGKSMSWRLDTIVRDSYYDLRQIGLDDETAYTAVFDC